MSNSYVVVRTKNRELIAKSLQNVGKSTTHIHMNGHPFMWALKEILVKAPNLQVVRAIPTMKQRYGQSHMGLLRGRGVKLTTGHCQKKNWGNAISRNPRYNPQRQFFLKLKGKQKLLFDELLRFEIDNALITARYYCLKGEDFKSQRVLAEDWNFKHESLVSCKIGAVTYYLDPTFQTTESNRKRAKAMEGRVWWLRFKAMNKEAAAKADEDFINRVGISCLPENLPPKKRKAFEALVLAYRGGQFDTVLATETRCREVMMTRYGLDDLEKPRVLTLREVGGMMGGVTRQCIQSHERRAFELLGIS